MLIVQAARLRATDGGQIDRAQPSVDHVVRSGRPGGVKKTSFCKLAKHPDLSVSGKTQGPR
jgi:hypothetical protein